MKIQGIAAGLALALLLPACRKGDTGKVTEFTADQTRQPTLHDQEPKLNASSNDRFQEPSTSPIVATVEPQGWLAQPSSSFRLLNYRFGTGGEVAVGVSSGGLSGNVNRWFAQFSKDPLTDEQLSALEKVTVLGVSGVWLEMQGDYSPGMGQPPRAAQGLAGVVADDHGRVITVKMTGPAEEVTAQKEALKAFIAGLRPRG